VVRVARLDETDANPADVQEQAEDATGSLDDDDENDDDRIGRDRTASSEVDEFDAAEQERMVDLDPDEYR
jgi:hypothetical protein